MHRSNPIGLACGLVFLGALGLGYLWTHDVPRKAQAWSTEAWLLAVGLAGCFLWWHGMRLRMLIFGVPTSRIASAPQGYVELAGRAVSARRIFSDVADFYLWKRVQFSSRSGTSDARSFPWNMFYVPTSVEVTETPFCIEDGTGQAVIVPVGAEVICSRREVQYQGDHKMVREVILDGDPLYVLGHFGTARMDIDVPALAERLVNDWKMDKAQMQRFDTNRDGYLWGSELLAMHREAKRVAAEKAAASAGSDGLNVVSAGADARRFVISNFPPDQLAGHYHWYLSLGLALAFAGMIGSVLFYRGLLSD